MILRIWGAIPFLKYTRLTIAQLAIFIEETIMTKIINIAYAYGRFTSFNEISDDKVDDNKLKLLVNGDESCIPKVLEFEKPYRSIGGMTAYGFDILTKYRSRLTGFDSSQDDSGFSPEFEKILKQNQSIYPKIEKYEKDLTLLAVTEDGCDFLFRNNNLRFFIFFSGGLPEFQQMGILQAMEWCELNIPDKVHEIFGEKNYIDERLVA